MGATKGSCRKGAVPRVGKAGDPKPSRSGAGGRGRGSGAGFGSVRRIGGKPKRKSKRRTINR